MDKIYVKAPAKINLLLNILSKREDGYHNLETIFQKISLYDELYIEKNNTDSILIDCNIPSLNSEDNLICKAYNALKNLCPSICGVDVKLIKTIPMQAGLGGGSSDCASFLLAMNTLFNLELSQKDLVNIGKNLGADVPPFFFGSTLKGEGIGEIITKLPSNLEYHLIIIKPKISCNTKEMYKIIDENEIVQNYNYEFILKALKTSNLQLLCDNLYNVFEEPIKDQVLNIKTELINNGALGACLTGSGSCIFGIFESEDSAKSAYNHLKDKYEIYLCTPI